MMKKLFLLAFAAFAFAACDDKVDSDLPSGYKYATENPNIVNGSLTGRNMHFFGKSATTDPKGGVYTDDKAYFEFAGGAEQMTVYMHTTRFAAEMPAVKMRIPTIGYTGTGNSVAFDVASIVPEAYVAATGAYTPMPRYQITNLKGSIDGIRCKVSFTCMGFKAEFDGLLIDNK